MNFLLFTTFTIIKFTTVTIFTLCLFLQLQFLEAGNAIILILIFDMNFLFLTNYCYICSFSGISSAVKLRKELGINAQIFEATGDIGGTWSYNTYPGCACDIPSHLYSFSFELNPSKCTSCVLFYAATTNTNLNYRLESKI